MIVILWYVTVQYFLTILVKGFVFLNVMFYVYTMYAAC